MDRSARQEYLFVYGTLKRGQIYNSQLDGCKFVASVVTVPSFRLHDYGPYPYLVRALERGIAIAGELFLVEEEHWARLDAFEGDQYRREKITLKGNGLEAYAYIYVGDDAYKLEDCGPEWPPKKEASLTLDLNTPAED